MLPVFAVLCLLGAIEHFGVDIQLAQWMFHLEGGVNTWGLRHWWFTDGVLHTGGRNLVGLMGLVLLLALGASHFRQRLKPYRRGFYYLFLCVLSSVMLVRMGKNLTNVSCPWDLLQFGGKFPYVPFPWSLSANDVGGQCFPGGHSSGAFAWICLYYFAAVYFPQHRQRVLLSVLTVGLVFSLCQEFRGAHFLSHDIWSLLLSWTLASLLFFVFFPAHIRRQLAD
ncbi:phosphatase PAP2 family protein [Shewanella cyperi]|uniref:phosphatase PAP2 family protein n=1 Tax=Shewanella cyperi TaxID=2814292 RepID=UPI001A953733|nr:phosphatase PAP2 family protein [Shewanella cyperi]QSX40833.1 phosphatase PAP2 family protein [Shewanella cyperi]